MSVPSIHNIYSNVFSCFDDTNSDDSGRSSGSSGSESGFSSDYSGSSGSSDDSASSSGSDITDDGTDTYSESSLRSESRSHSYYSYYSGSSGSSDDSDSFDTHTQTSVGRNNDLMARPSVSSKLSALTSVSDSTLHSGGQFGRNNDLKRRFSESSNLTALTSVTDSTRYGCTEIAVGGGSGYFGDETMSLQVIPEYMSIGVTLESGAIGGGYFNAFEIPDNDHIAPPSPDSGGGQDNSVPNDEDGSIAYSDSFDTHTIYPFGGGSGCYGDEIVKLQIIPENTSIGVTPESGAIEGGDFKGFEILAEDESNSTPPLPDSNSTPPLLDSVPNGEIHIDVYGSGSFRDENGNEIASDRLIINTLKYKLKNEDDYYLSGKYNFTQDEADWFNKASLHSDDKELISDRKEADHNALWNRSEEKCKKLEKMIASHSPSLDPVQQKVFKAYQEKVMDYYGSAVIAHTESNGDWSLFEQYGNRLHEEVMQKLQELERHPAGNRGNLLENLESNIKMFDSSLSENEFYHVDNLRGAVEKDFSSAKESAERGFPEWAEAQFAAGVKKYEEAMRILATSLQNKEMREWRADARNVSPPPPPPPSPSPSLMEKADEDEWLSQGDTDMEWLSQGDTDKEWLAEVDREITNFSGKSRFFQAIGYENGKDHGEFRRFQKFSRIFHHLLERLDSLVKNARGISGDDGQYAETKGQIDALRYGVAIASSYANDAYSAYNMTTSKAEDAGTPAHSASEEELENFIERIASATRLDKQVLWQVAAEVDFADRKRASV